MPVTVTPARVREALDFSLDSIVMPDSRITDSDCAAIAVAEVESRVSEDELSDPDNEETLNRAADLFTAACLAPSLPGLLGVVYAANAPGSQAPVSWKAKMEVLRQRGEEQLQRVIGGSDDAMPGVSPHSTSTTTVIQW